MSKLDKITPKFEVVVVGRIDSPAQGIGNQPAGSRFFSRRPDVTSHMHKPGAYYCGRCMSHVLV